MIRIRIHRKWLNSLKCSAFLGLGFKVADKIKTAVFNLHVTSIMCQGRSAIVKEIYTLLYVDVMSNNHFFSFIFLPECNNSLVRKELMSETWPTREIGISNTDKRTLYLSHIMNLFPFWCVTVKKDYQLYFSFKAMMFITGFMTEGDHDKYFGYIRMGYSTVGLETSNFQLNFDYYIENRTSGEARVRHCLTC